MVYALIVEWERQDQGIVRRPQTAQEEDQLVEAGFEYVRLMKQTDVRYTARGNSHDNINLWLEERGFSMRLIVCFLGLPNAIFFLSGFSFGYVGEDFESAFENWAVP